MRRTTPARSARDARRPARAIHLRAASVVALAALGVGVAPAVAVPLTGTHSAIVTADKSDAASDQGGTSDGNGESDGTDDGSTDNSSTPTDPAEATQKSGGASDGGTAVPTQSTPASPSEKPPQPTENESRPTLKLGRESVPAGQGTRLKVNGFSPAAQVTVTVVNTKTKKTFTVDDNGSGSTWLKIGKDTPTGAYDVSATDGKGTTATQALDVTEASDPSPAAIELKDDEVETGAKTEVSGSHFWSRGSVTVQVRDGNQIVTTTTSQLSDGEFTATVKAPDTAGKYNVVATAGSKGHTKSGSAPLDVTGSSGSDGGGDGETSAPPTSNKPPSTSTPPPTSTTSPEQPSSTAPSNSSSSSSSSTTSTTPSDSSSSSASTTSEVPPATSTRDSSKEIELSAPSDESSSKSTETEKSEKKDTAEKPTKGEDSEKAKDEDKKTSETPQETSDQPVSDEQSDATQAAATMDEDDTTSSGPTTVTTEDDGGGPLVKLFSSIGGEDASGMNRIRQVFVATLGVAFLTAAGFTTASWLSRRSGTHSARAGLRQLFHRRH